MVDRRELGLFGPLIRMNNNKKQAFMGKKSSGMQ
jgi:hypothetical protein